MPFVTDLTPKKMSYGKRQSLSSSSIEPLPLSSLQHGDVNMPVRDYLYKDDEGSSSNVPNAKRAKKKKTSAKTKPLRPSLKTVESRRKQNRERVRRFRQKNRNRLSSLEERNIELETENARLRGANPRGPMMIDHVGESESQVSSAQPERMNASQEATCDRFRVALNSGVDALVSASASIWYVRMDHMIHVMYSHIHVIFMS